MAVGAIKLDHPVTGMRRKRCPVCAAANAQDPARVIRQGLAIDGRQVVSGRMVLVHAGTGAGRQAR